MTETNTDKFRGSIKGLNIIIYALSFAGIIIFLNQYDNTLYQLPKEIQASWAALLFLIAMVEMQRVKWLNWQTLLVTLIWVPVAFFRCNMYAGSPDLLLNNILHNVVQWLALVVITDMVVTKRVRDFRQIHLFTMVFYVLMAALPILFSSGKDMSLYLYMLILFLIPTESKEAECIGAGLLIGGFLSFLIITVISFVSNPVFGVSEAQFMLRNVGQSGRWFGYFLNIGAFGQYLGLSTAFSVGSIYYTKEKFGKKNVLFWISILWLLATLFMAVLNGTRNYALALVGLLTVLFVFGWKKTTPKGCFIRGGIIILILGLGIFAILRLGVYVMSDRFDPQALQRIADKSPIPKLTSGVGYFVELLNYAHMGLGKGYYGREIFRPDSLGSFLNTLSSNRLGICYEFLARCTWRGSAGGGLLYGNYYAFNSHNQYIQALYDYGFLAGGIQILFALYAWVRSIVYKLKCSTPLHFLPMILITMMLGIWMGEQSTIHYPMTFFALLASAPLFLDFAGKQRDENA